MPNQGVVVQPSAISKAVLREREKGWFRGWNGRHTGEHRHDRICRSGQRKSALRFEETCRRAAREACTSIESEAKTEAAGGDTRNHVTSRLSRCAANHC